MRCGATRPKLRLASHSLPNCHFLGRIKIETRAKALRQLAVPARLELATFGLGKRFCRPRLSGSQPNAFNQRRIVGVCLFPFSSIPNLINKRLWAFLFRLLFIILALR
jgi:hypothetical protein